MTGVDLDGVDLDATATAGLYDVFGTTDVYEALDVVWDGCADTAQNALSLYDEIVAHAATVDFEAETTPARVAAQQVMRNMKALAAFDGTEPDARYLEESVVDVEASMGTPIDVVDAGAGAWTVTVDGGSVCMNPPASTITDGGC